MACSAQFQPPTILERRCVAQVAARRRSSVAVSEYTLEILALISRVCLCRPLDPCHHRATCSRVGILGGSWYSLKSAAAGVWEAGARVSTNVFLRDFSLDTVQANGRMLEVVAEGQNTDAICVVLFFVWFRFFSLFTAHNPWDIHALAQNNRYHTHFAVRRMRTTKSNKENSKLPRKRPQFIECARKN